MVKREFDRSAALKTIAQLARSGGDEQLAEMATKIHARLRRPMTEILRKVPGRNASDKARRCGVSRQAWYDWLKGVYRPTGEQAQRIAKLTGIPVAYIRGRGEKPRRKPKPSGENAAA
jgi:transcriptional regulator with XRE-family HTH domain